MDAFVGQRPGLIPALFAASLRVFRSRFLISSWSSSSFTAITKEIVSPGPA